MQSNTVPHLITTLAGAFGQLMEASGCDPYNPTDVNQFIDGINLPTKIKREIMEMYSEPKDDVDDNADVPLEIIEDLDPYVSNGFKDRAEYLQHLSDEYMVPIDMVETVAETLGETEDFDGLVAAIQDMVE